MGTARAGLRGRHVLVTGGAGYIGSHACKALAQAGYIPVTYDTLEMGHRAAVRWGPLEVGDVREPDRLHEVLRRYTPVAVLHFAAYISVGESVEKPAKYLDNNVGGTRMLLEALRAEEVRAVIFSSSAAVYGSPERSPIAEDHPIRPINPYGESKMAAEALLREFARDGSGGAVALRYFNAAGADAEAQLGESHHPETHLIPLVLDVALGRAPAVTLFGDRYATPDGTCVRDYVHVADLADAHVLALERLLAGARGFSAYNLGNSRGHSVREVVEAARQVTGKPIATIVAAPRPGDEAVLVSDSARARKELEWSPRYAELSTQIAHAWKWHQRAANLD